MLLYAFPPARLPPFNNPEKMCEVNIVRSQINQLNIFLHSFFLHNSLTVKLFL